MSDDDWNMDIIYDENVRDLRLTVARILDVDMPVRYMATLRVDEKNEDDVPVYLNYIEMLRLQTAIEEALPVIQTDRSEQATERAKSWMVEKMRRAKI